MNIPYRMSLLPAFVCLKGSLFEFVNETLYFITVLVLQKNYKDRWEERDKEKEKERERERWLEDATRVALAIVQKTHFRPSTQK